MDDMLPQTKKTIFLQSVVAVFNFIKIQRALTDKAKIGILPTDDFVLEKIIFLAQSVARVQFH